MGKLKTQLKIDYKEKIPVEAPRNCQRILFEFETLRQCTIVGKLAEKLEPI